MTLESKEKTVFSLNWKFLGYFLLYLSLLFFLGQIPLSSLQKLKTFTAFIIAVFWKAFSAQVAHAGTSIRFFTFSMDITLECTALHYMAVYSAGVLAYQAHSLSYRMVGIVFGIASIVLLNIIRVGLLGIVGHYSSGMFNFVHVYLWQGTFALLVLLIWILWVNGRHGSLRLLMRYILYSFVAASLSFWCLNAFLDYYASLLAVTANAVFYLLSTVSGIKIASFAEGGRIGYGSIQGVIYNNISIDVFNSVIFCALAAATADLAQRAVLVKRIGVGAVLLYLQHLAYAVMYGIVLVRGMEPDAFAALLWFTRGFSMAMPLLIWLFTAAVFRSVDRR